MTLDELDQQIAETPIVSPAHMGLMSTETWRERETRHLKAGECPKCGYKIDRSDSEYGTGIIWFTCQRPDEDHPHLFTRYIQEYK